MSELTEMTDTAEDAVTEAMESEEVGEKHPGWHRQVALTTLVMALLAGLGGLLAGITAHEALLKRTKEIIEVSYLEGDRVHVETLNSKHEILTALGETPNRVEVERVVAFEEEMRELKAGTAREEALALTADNTHLIFAVAVVLLSLGITLGGMAVIVEHKFLWTVGLVFGVAGAAGIGLGVLAMLS
jgi:hypothetical protein